jgi:serine/threonine protein kinase/tetratricopeptide (TPR) repeat protein
MTGPEAPEGSPALADDRAAPGWKAVEELEAAWAGGDLPAAAVWGRHAGAGPAVLAAMIKADLRRRFGRGDRPAIREYLDRFAPLADDPERVLSLVYEEFCLREENGEAPDADAFCLAYATWGDSLASQLRYHRLLSQVAGGPRSLPKYPVAGERFQQFHLRDLLGKGGSAVVFLADDEALGNRPTALKITADRGEEPAIMGRLDHHRIVPINSVVRDPASRLRGLCMPYRPSLPLNLVLDRMAAVAPRRRRALDLLRAALPAGETAITARDGWAGFPVAGSYSEAVAWVGMVLAEGLDHAHRRGILHRDIKPANILITVQAGPQLLDFNLASSRNSSPEQAEEAHRGGTLPYMAPEQLDAFLDEARWDAVGPAADLYSLGLVLREMLVGERPEAPDADISMPRAIRELRDWRGLPPGPIAPRNPAVSPGLEAIIRKCLDPDPARRFPDARALADELERLLAREWPRHVQNPSRRELLRNWAHRNRTRAIAAGLTAVVAAWAAQFAWTELRKTPWHRGAELLQAGRITEAEDQFILARREVGPVPRDGYRQVALLRKDLRDRAHLLAKAAVIDAEAHRALIDRAKLLGYEVDSSVATEWNNVVHTLLSRPSEKFDREARALASQYIEEIDSVIPGDHRAFQIRGVFAEKLGRLAEAAEYYERAVLAPSLKKEPREVEVEFRRQWAGSLGAMELDDRAMAEIEHAWAIVESGDGFSSTDARSDARCRLAHLRGLQNLRRANGLVKKSKELLDTRAGQHLILAPANPGNGRALSQLIRLNKEAYSLQDEALRWVDLALETPCRIPQVVETARRFREQMAACVESPRVRSAPAPMLVGE